MADGLPPFIAFVCGWLLVASRVPHGFGAAFQPATFTHWDSGQYLSIARHGYRMRMHCHRGRHTRLPGVHVCANVTWFAGYPLLMRALSVTGTPLAAAGLIIAWVCWYLALLMIWLLTDPAPERAASRWGTVTRWLCLLLAAFFPSQIYFAAIFPISMAAFGMLACCYWSARVPNRPLAAIAGILAGSAYLPAVAVIPGLAAAAVAAKNHRARVAMCWGAAGVAAGVGAVLGYAQLAVGRWDAYFFTERVEYHVRIHDPLATIAARFGSFVPLPESAAHRAVAEQGFLLALLLVLALVGFAACARTGLQAVDTLLVIATAVEWLIPYVGAGKLRIYRAEGLMIVLVPLLRRLPPWVLVIPLAAAIWVAAAMAPLFVQGLLV